MKVPGKDDKDGQIEYLKEALREVRAMIDRYGSSYGWCPECQSHVTIESDMPARQIADTIDKRLNDVTY